MKRFHLLFVLCLLFTGCSEDGLPSSDPESTSDIESGSSGNQGNGQDTSAGQITAGEWNDLDNWAFWTDLLNKQEDVSANNHWKFYTNNRLAFNVTAANASPVNGASIIVYKNGVMLSEVKTDNFGKANLFIGLNQNIQYPNISEYSVTVNGVVYNQNLLFFNDGTNDVTQQTLPAIDDKIEISFIVDATGSMGDELEFLKNDLQDVISTVKNNNQTSVIATSTVFYRDYGDAYVVKHSDFTTTTNTTLNFIQQQFADGGGDFPEAVDAALHTAITDLQWTTNAKTKLAFLILDAPPHHEPQVIDGIHTSIKKAAANGIKLIPITASGIDKSTEFLMRFIAISTNGTYVFITNDSGIGNDHLEPTVGAYQVELLNALMVRLINKYSE